MQDTDIGARFSLPRRRTMMRTKRNVEATPCSKNRRHQHHDKEDKNHHPSPHLRSHEQNKPHQAMRSTTRAPTTKTP